MRIDRAVKIQADLTSAVRDLYSLARTFKLTSSEINERYAKLIARYPKLPRHVENYVRGYRDCLSDSLYHHDLFHAYEWQGQLYEKWESMPDEMKEHIRQTPTDSLVHGHYWKGTSRPYFLGAWARDSATRGARRWTILSTGNWSSHYETGKQGERRQPVLWMRRPSHSQWPWCRG